MEAPQAVDADGESVTVEWAPAPGAALYALQWRPAGQGEWATASEALRSCTVRKRNLEPGAAFQFRCRAQAAAGGWGEWSPPSAPQAVLSPQQLAQRPGAPRLQARDGASLTVAWEASAAAPPGAAQRHEVQMREAGAPWRTLSADLKGEAMRKKGLQGGREYFFRVRSRAAAGGDWTAFSPPSEGLAPRRGPELPAAFRHALGPQLRAPGGERVGLEALAGCTIALYFSASWCGPCRQFTPRLADFYKQMKREGRRFEVVFVSADRDERSFAGYHGTMPWAAVPFDAEEREACMAQFHVRGIPQLTVYNPDGSLRSANAVQQPLSVAALGIP